MQPTHVTPDETRTKWLLSWAVHLYTSLGLVCSLLALLAVAEGRPQAVFAWLIVAFAIDSSDGTLARRVDVTRWTPDFSGRKLDDITDYINYTFIPIFFIYRFGLVSPAWIPVLAFTLIASAYGFCNDGAKTDDGFFTGFPSYWNVVAFYLYALRLSSLAAGIIILVLALMTFWPVKYLYPSKTPYLKKWNIGLGILWAVVSTVVAFDLEDPDPWLVYASLFYPLYYMGLSIYWYWFPPAASEAHR